jgi:endonuclease YncB( thermonuclease family)
LHIARSRCKEAPMLRLLLLVCPVLVAVLGASPALATIFEGEVIRVKDGDSLMLYRPDVKRTSEIRLAGIDAPELAQPWGLQARSALRRKVERRDVRVQVVDRDRYGRLVGRIWVGPTYVNSYMTLYGHAWAFDRYMKDRQIRAGQDRARREKRGLWALPPADRLPPATWRERHPRTNAP